MRIFITGATGFIGRHLVRELAGRGHELVCLVRSRRNAAELESLGASLCFGDVTNEESLSRVPSCDIVFHCAALVEARGLARLRKVNVGGTENVCRLATRMNARRLVYVSSVAVINGNPGPLFTADLPYAATNDYGISKIEAERKVLEFRARGLPCAILRPPMVYGEGEPHALDRLCSLLKAGLLPLIDGGRCSLHLAYVRNVAAGLVLAMERPEFLSGAFFCADEQALNVAGVLGILAKSIGAPPPVSIPRPLAKLLFALPVAGDKLKVFCKDRIYDVKPLMKNGYKDVLPVKEALALTGKWWKEKKRPKKSFYKDLDNYY